MPKTAEPLAITFFATGLYTHRSQLFSPYRVVGVNVVTYHDAAIDGLDMELGSRLQWTRRPGFARFCSQALGASEFPLQFYSVRQPSGSVVAFVDTNQNLSVFTSAAITAIVAKSTTAQGFIQQVGRITYYANGSDMKQWNGAATMGWGIQAPLVAPTITSTGSGQFWQPMLTVASGTYVILDPNGNFQKMTTLGTTGASTPVWNTTFGGATVDNTAVWSNAGPYGGWQPATAYALGTIIVDSNQNLQECTTAGTSGSSSPTWAVILGNVTNDGTVHWAMRGIGTVNSITPTAATYPTAAAVTGSGTTWFSIANIEAADGSSATVNFPAAQGSYTSRNLQGTGFGFSVPGTATISGIKVELGLSSPSSSLPPTGHVAMIKGGTIAGVSRYFGWPTNQTTLTFGGSSDLWGLALTPADVNASNFGANITAAAVLAQGDTSQGAVDFVRITVYYVALTATTLGTGQIYAYAGYTYAACYHSVSGQVSTASPLTYPTGSILGQFQNMMTVPSSPDPDCDQVQFYRNDDGGGLLYLIGSVPNTGATVTFIDNTIPDASLVTTVIAPLDHLNDPPPFGTILAYWQGRIWMAVGNKLYFDAGPDCINGVPEESWPPANVFQYPGPITGLSPTSQGLLVWGADYLSMALGGPQTLSFFPYDLMKNFGVSSPNCIAQDGDTISVLTTAGQCFTLTDAGKSETGQYIVNLLSNFAPSASYVSIHRQGTDAGLWLGDGSTNLLRYSLNVGAWSTLYAPVGGIGAVRSIETSVGVYTLCAGRTTGGGYILGRSVSTWQDDGQNYPNAFVTIGSITLTQPGGTLVPVQHVVGYFDAVGTLGPLISGGQVTQVTGGPTQPTIAILPNEVSASAGSGFLTLGQPRSEYTTAQLPTASLLSLRWDVDSMNVQALVSQFMHHLQIRVSFPPENAPNSIKSLALMFEKDK